MITDAERRKVVENLRDSLIRCSRDDFGDEFEWFTETVCGPIDTLHQMELEDVIARLADLIEPGEPKVKCVAEVKVDGEKLEKLVHDAAVELTDIDRDALLALAVELDELEKHYDGKYKDTYNLFYSGVAEGVCIAADMLREALGVEDA